MCRDELCTKAAALAQLHHGVGADPAALADLKQLLVGESWSGHSSLDVYYDDWAAELFE